MSVLGSRVLCLWQVKSFDSAYGVNVYNEEWVRAMGIRLLEVGSTFAGACAGVTRGACLVK